MMSVANPASYPAQTAAAAGSIAAEVLRAYLFVRQEGQLRRLRLADVQYFEADGSSTIAVLAGERLSMRRGIQELTAELAPDGFVRTHRAYLINLAYFEGLGGGEPRALVAGTPLPLSRTHRPALLACLRLA